MNNSEEQAAGISDNLDVEYREKLCLIKNCIQFVTSNYHLSQYKAWLEKMNDATIPEKPARNFYLRKLAQQIERNILSAPFDQAPPSGPLKILPVNENQTTMLCEEWSKLCQGHQHRQAVMLYLYVKSYENGAEDTPENPSWSDDESGSSFFTHYSAPNTFFESSSCTGWSDSSISNVKHSSMGNLIYLQESQQNSSSKDAEVKSKKLRKLKYRKLEDIDHVNFCEALNGQNDEVQGLQMRRNQNYSRNYKASENISSIKEDSSWCDLTDADSTTIVLEGSGDAEKLLKTDSQEGDGQKLDGNIKKNDIPIETDVGETTISPSQERALIKLGNIMETKVSLKDTNFISEDWKKTIEGLQLRLTETVNQNNELKNVVHSLQVQLKEDSVKYHEDLQRNLKQSESKYMNEIKSLKKIHAEKMYNMEKSCEKKLETKIKEAEQAFQQKTAVLVENYEMRIRELRHDHENCVQCKEKEIKKLTDVIDSQCERTVGAIAELQNQISSCKIGEEKVQVLQKCVSKMDKLFERSEKEYLKQIQKLQQELKLNDKIMQVHLSSQKADLLAHNIAVKQEEFDQIVNELEVKYIKMLEQHESQTMASRKEDNEKIEHLLNLLNQYNIPYDDQT